MCVHTAGIWLTCTINIDDNSVKTHDYCCCCSAAATATTTTTITTIAAAAVATSISKDAASDGAKSESSVGNRPMLPSGRVPNMTVW